ncbi:MAG TPA: LytTR family DNA-binding domain-containing protein [Flavobacteriales bacterium]|nr:LytTR family DNA-binding domain-containing protein [Flavobacteriales bacterium]
MITAVLVDDEPNALNYLQTLVEKNVPEIILTGKASNISEAALLIERVKPDIVFLDIELQTATGFDLLAQINNLNFQVIFTTAHEKYALKAIKFAAVDFLIKPIDTDELKAAVTKVIRQTSGNARHVGLDVLLANLKSGQPNKKIAISTTKGISVVEITKIVYCKSDGPYTEIHTVNETVLSSKNLKEYEDLLDENGFFRCHKSFLINLNEIKQYVRADGGYVVMSNGQRIDVSDRKKEELLKKLSPGIIVFD